MTHLRNTIAAGLLAGVFLSGCASERSTPAETRFGTPAAAFVVSGAFAYPQERAIPGRGVLVVQLRGGPAPSGAILAERRFTLDGGQLPVSFSLPVPERELEPGMVPVLRGRVMVNGHATWASAPVAIDVAIGDVDVQVDVGTLAMEQQEPLAFPTVYQCGDRTVMVARDADAGRLIMRVGFESLRLRRVIAPAGRKYEAEVDSTTTFLDRGTEARVTVAGEAWQPCTRVARADRLFVASGNEPGWRLDLDVESLTLSADYGALTLAAATPLARWDDGLTIYRTRSGAGGEGARGASGTARDLEIRIEDRTCRASMTGMPYPRRVELRVGERKLDGCGGDPLELLHGEEWVVEAVNGTALLDASRATVGFMKSSRRLAGRATCNHYAGSFQLGGEGLSTGAIYATETACDEALMAQERRVLEVLRGLERFDIDDSGALILHAGGGGRLTARR